jgi:predicted nucleic acid-binding protein
VTSLPLRSIAADSNVLLAAVARRAAWRVFESARDLLFVTTEMTIAEVHKYAPEFADRYGFEVEVLHEAIELLPVRRYAETMYGAYLAEANRLLAHRDPDDVHLLALALRLEVPVWSNDSDFRGLPIEVFTTAQLLKILGV